MSAYVTLPDGRSFERRPGESIDDALNAAAHQYPEVFGIERQQGFVPAFKAGLKSFKDSSMIGAGYATGNAEMEARGRAMAAEQDMTPGAYEPMTGERVSEAFDRGIWDGAGAWTQKNITEVLGGVAGRYGVPMAASAGAGALAGPGAFIAAPAAMVAADAPAQLGESLLQSDRYAQQQQDRGLPIPQVQNSDLYVGALAQAALMPLFSKLGGAATHNMFKLMGPDIAATAKAVQRGDMTKEAAIQKLNSTARNYLVKTGEMAVVGPAMMAGTEAIKTGASGEELDSPESKERLWGAVHEGVVSAPLFGAMGAFGRTGQVRTLNKAGEKWDATDAQIKAAGGTRAEVEAAAQQAEAARVAAAQQAEAARAEGGPSMDLSIMPQHMKDFSGPTDPNARARSIDSFTPEQPKNPTHGAPFAGVKDGVVTDAMFNALGVGNGKKTSALDAELRSFVGQPIAPVAARIRELLVDQQEKAGRKGAAAWANREGAVDRVQRVLDNLPREEAPVRADPTISPPVTRQVDMFDQEGRPTAESFTTPARMEGFSQTEQQVAAQKRNDPVIMQEMAREHLKSQNTQSDMFDPTATAPKVRIPEPTVADTAIEYAKRKAELRSQYEVAREAGDHAAAARIIDMAEVELGMMSKVIRDRESTQDMFTEQGRPTEAATAHRGLTDQLAMFPHERRGFTGPTDPNAHRRGLDDLGMAPARPAEPVGDRGRSAEYTARNKQLFEEFEKAQAEGNVARMNELIQIHKESLPDLPEAKQARVALTPEQKLGALKTQSKLFGITDKPTKAATSHELATRKREAAEAKEIADNRAANAAVRGAREVEAPNVSDALKRGSGYDALVASDKEKVVEAKSRVAAGASEKVDALATGLGRAAKAETLQELTPTHTKLPADRASANLWWNDLAHISMWNKNTKGTTPEQHQLAKAAIMNNSTLTVKNKTFTEAQLANAESKNKNIVATARSAEKKAAEKALREAETNAAVNKEQLKAEDKATKEAAEDVIRQQNVAKAKAARLSESTKEEAIRSKEEDVDPDVVAAESEAQRLLTIHKKISPEATIMVETVDANGNGTEVKVNARKQVGTTTKNLDAIQKLINCLGVS